MEHSPKKDKRAALKPDYRRAPLIGLDNSWATIGVLLFLAIATWIVFGQTLHHEFVNFDDDAYVYQNPAIKNGISLESVLWSLTHRQDANWHPLTSMSHMLDCQLYGLKPGGHHLTSVALHAANAMLLFLAMRRMRAAFWRSAFLAAVFAVHPLRVESVAWVAERKDVLSGLFFMLTLWAYAGYARKPTLLRYGGVAGLFALGLMCKPMLVSLPVVLLILDYWPLGRFALKTRIPGKLIFEKVPLFVLSGAACVVTLFAQAPAIHQAEGAPLSLRLANAVVSIAVYLKQAFWPAGLAVFYPYPIHGLPGTDIITACLALIAISAWAYWWRASRPYFLAGWLWYLAMLLPVLGLVQVGQQARADRYTYLPQIGIAMMLTWTASEWGLRQRDGRARLATGAAIILAALAAGARVQTEYWRDSVTLWTRALAVAPDNALAESNLGNCLFQLGRFDESMEHCGKALELEPEDVGANNCLGFALLQEGHSEEAMAHFRVALKVQPDFAPAHNNLGMALLQIGEVDRAIAEFQAALQTDPELADTHNNLGAALVRKGRTAEAIAHYQKAIELKPDYAGACNNLAWVLATSPEAGLRNGDRALRLAQEANRLAGANSLVIWRTLAAAYAETGRFAEASESATQALRLAEVQGNQAWADALRKDMRLYQSKEPLRDQP